jgi:penicillin-binding protein 1A
MPRRKARKKPAFKIRLPKARTLLRPALLAGLWGFIALVLVIGWYAIQLPRLIDTAAMTRKPSVTILAEDGSVIARYGEITGAVVGVKDLPPHLINAVLAVEDRRFYHHFGVDPIGIARAVYVNFSAGRTVQGGSTLTQQLAKNLFLSPERSLNRKIQEALLALWLEWKYTKDEILTAYLNRVYLGAGAYGVDAAARVYYNKTAQELTLKESATIAGLLRAPSRYAPSANPEKAEERMQTVLGTMVDAGFLTPAELKRMRAQDSAPKARAGGNEYGRYFADYVLDLVEDYIGADHGDIVVQTTLRPALQRGAEAAVQDYVAQGADKRVGNGAAVILSPDGAVRALVGGKDYGDSQFNRAVQALRQPGSSFKPFIYLAAIEHAGYTPDTLVEDAPLEIANYSPDNYTGDYAGWIPLREALAKSLNTVAVRLLQEVSLSQAQKTTRKLGLPTPASTGLSYALGTAEVSLLQLTGAYAALGNGGYAVAPYAILMIRTQAGELLWRRQAPKSDQVIAPEQLAMLVDMMKGVTQFGTGTAAALPDRITAGKTGTSQDFRDAWFMGFTGNYIGGVWMGNDDNKGMKKVTGGSLPARCWKAMMSVAESGQSARGLPTDGISYASSSERRGGGPLDPLAEAGLLPYGTDEEGPNMRPGVHGNGGFSGVLRELTDEYEVR